MPQQLTRTSIADLRSGNGRIVVTLKEIDVPIKVLGRHWGALRLAVSCLSARPHVHSLGAGDPNPALRDRPLCAMSGRSITDITRTSLFLFILNIVRVLRFLRILRK